MRWARWTVSWTMRTARLDGLNAPGNVVNIFHTGNPWMKTRVRDEG